MYFEDFSLGQKLPGPRLTVTEAHVVNFGTLTGDWAMLHFDEEMAKRHTFGRRIAHGMLTASLAMGPMSQIMGREAATHLEDSFVYRDPVFLGDTIEVFYDVLELLPKSKWGLVKLSMEVRNQHDKVVMTGWTKVGVRYKHPRPPA